MIRRAAWMCCLALAMGGCSLLFDGSDLTADAVDGGQRDGGLDGGTRDGGREDGGPADGGPPDGASLLADGEPCAQSTECESSFCADGVCCDRACDGQCEACDQPEARGVCTFVTGSPAAPRPPCNGTGTCGGSCDGTSASCRYPPAGTICGGGCDGTCDGDGACSGSGGVCPGGFACGSEGTCLTSCTTVDDCQPFFACDDGACQRVPENNCLDGIDNNGDGLADCLDPTCAGSQVTCVPAVGAGATLGILLDGGPCPPGYDSSQPLLADLTPQPCLGCTCATRCSTTIRTYANSNCSGSATTFTLNGLPGTLQCATGASANRQSGLVVSNSVSGCTPGGTATQAAPTWATNKLFCVARSSMTCTRPDEVCVPLPPSTPACARVAEADSCPAGYDDGSLYYTSFTPGSCGPCNACTPATTMGCGSFVPQAGTGSCSGTAATDLLSTSCDPIGPSRNPVNIAKAQLTSSGTDNCSISPSRTDPGRVRHECETGREARCPWCKCAFHGIVNTRSTPS